MKHLISFALIIALAAADDWLDWQIRLAGIGLVALIWYLAASSKSTHRSAPNDHAEKPFLVHQRVERRRR